MAHKFNSVNSNSAFSFLGDELNLATSVSGDFSNFMVSKSEAYS